MFRQLAAPTLIVFVAATSASAGDSISKDWDWGDSEFGLSISGKASGSVNNKDKINMDGSASFKAKLFGGSKKASVSFDGVYGDNTKQMEAKLKIDGVVLSTKDKTFSGQVSYNLASKALIEVSKQYVLWSVPVVVKADVSAGANIGFGYEVEPNGSTNPNKWENEYEVFAAVGAAGTVTVGPGSDSIGAGIYGSVNFGEVQMAAVRATPYFGGKTKSQLQVDTSMGDFEMGVVAWVADVEVSHAILEIEGFRKNLKTVNL